MENILKIKDKEISCGFNTSKVQEKLDSIIVFSALTELNVQIKNYNHCTSISIYKDNAEIDIMYMRLKFNKNNILDSFLAQLHTFSLKSFSTNDEEELLSFLEKTYTLLSEEM